MESGVSALWLFLLLWFPLSPIIMSATYKTDFTISSNQRLKTTNYSLVFLEERLVVSQLMCAHWCLRTPLCLSFNLEKDFQSNKGERRCEILASNKMQRPDLLEEDSNFDHYGSFGSPCEENPCQHEGVCEPDYSSQDYRCICISFFFKIFLKSPCEENPCQHEGVCEPDYSSQDYRCICKPGYTGKDCQKDVDECADSKSCHPYANCVNMLGSYRCYCRRGFVVSGKICQDINECSGSHTCHRSHGYCLNTVGSYNCYCKSGYVGDGRICTVRECVQYHNLRERTRNINYGLVGTKCDSSGILTAGAWYRFADSAGTRMLDRCPTTKCDTAFQGWLRGGQPGYGQVKVARTVCYQGNSNCCNWPLNIRATHCKYFIVYELKPVGGCSIRYCGTF